MRRPAEFAAAVRSGARAGSRAVTVHVAPSSAADATEPRQARVGFVVARSVGSAVVRNRVRRRLRHLLGARLAALPTGLDIVVRAHPQSADLPSAELGRDFDAALTAALERASSRAGAHKAAAGS